MKYRTRIVAILTCAVLCPGMLLAQPPPPASPAPQDRRVFVEFDQVPPVLLLTSLALDVSCKLDIEGTLPKSSVSLRMSNVRARTALDAACDMIGCRWRIEGQSLRVDMTTPPPPMTSGQQFVEKLGSPLRGARWNIERVALRDVLAWLSQELGVQVVADNADPSTLISADLMNRSPSEAFLAIQRALGWNVISSPGRTYSLSAGGGPTPVKPQLIHLTGRTDPNWRTEAGVETPRILEKGEPGLTMPRLMSEVHPQYSDEARRAKIQGKVTLSCVVDTDGRITDVNIVTALDPGLDNQAIEALRQWRFAPGLKDGKPVPVRVEVEMTFTLR